MNEENDNLKSVPLEPEIIDDKKKGKKIKKAAVWDYAKTLTIAFLLMFAVRFFLVQPYFVSGSSMEPDFHNGEYILIDEVSYRFSEPSRGDVIVFKHPDPDCVSYVENSYFLKDIFSGPCQIYIKRIIGLPGETVRIDNGEVRIITGANPDGFVLNETYIEEGIETAGDQTVSLGKDEFFVLGDNRLPFASSDSREWGALPRQYINGQAFIRLFPVTSGFGFIPGAEY